LGIARADRQHQGGANACDLDRLPENSGSKPFHIVLPMDNGVVGQHMSRRIEV
jgi:hypothetical protein